MSAAAPADLAALRGRAEYWAKGRAYEAFATGQVFEHRWSRTLTEADSIAFSTQTLHFNPIYFSRERGACAGHADIVVNPLLTLNVAIGLSVEDLSEAGGPFVGITEVRFGATVVVGTTLGARSTTMQVRESASRPEFGLVTWRTEGFDEFGRIVVSFLRSNLVMKRGPMQQRLRRMVGHDRIVEMSG